VAKTKKRKLVEIIWLDPSRHTIELDILKEAIQNNTLKDFLTETHSYGVIAAEDDKVIVLKNLENELGKRQITVIEKSLIQDTIPYYQKSKTKSKANY